MVPIKLISKGKLTLEQLGGKAKICDCRIFCNCGVKPSGVPSHDPPEVNKCHSSIFVMADERYESEETFEPVDYFVSENGLAVAVERCPLCLRSRRPIYCKDCVNSGNFSGGSGDSERQEGLHSLNSMLSMCVISTFVNVTHFLMVALKHDHISREKVDVYCCVNFRSRYSDLFQHYQEKTAERTALAER